MKDLFGNDIKEPSNIWIGDYLTPSEPPEYSMKNLNQDKDQYYTKPEIAKMYYDKTIEWLKENNYNLNDYTFIELTAGQGSFFKLMPAGSIGLDIDPQCEGVEYCNVLEWQPDKNKKYIYIGNLPFGKNGSFALTIFERLAKCNVEIAASILPMGFHEQSPIKTNAMKKIGYYNKFCEVIPENSFILPDGKERNINCVFVIYDRKEESEEELTCDSFVDIYKIILEDRPTMKQENIDKIKECDLFIKKNFGNISKPKIISSNIKELNANHVIGIKIKKDKEKMLKYFEDNDLKKNIITCSAVNEAGISLITLNKYKLIDFIIQGGFIDPPKNATCDSYVEMYCIANYENTKRGIDKIDLCDIFIKRSSYNKKIITKQITEPYFYTGLKIKKDKEKIINYLENYNWDNERKTGSDANTIGMNDIKQILIEGGFYDKPIPKKYNIEISHIRSHGDINEYEKIKDKYKDYDIFVKRSFNAKSKNQYIFDNLKDAYMTRGDIKPIKADKEIIDFIKNYDWKKNLPRVSGDTNMVEFSKFKLFNILKENGYE